MKDRKVDRKKKGAAAAPAGLHKSIIDPITEIGGRGDGEAALRSRLGELKRYGWHFGVIFIGIDNFKPFSVKYGHEAGDWALKMVADNLKKSARPFDTFCRWGPDEFLVVLANIKEGDLFIAADRFRSLVEQSSLRVGGEAVGVTVSVGATIVKDDDTVSGIVERADKLMYHSKEAGGNRVSMK